eukprot:1160533-Pelagomonas_calceolata.AAC.18
MHTQACARIGVRTFSLACLLCSRSRMRAVSTPERACVRHTWGRLSHCQAVVLAYAGMCTHQFAPAYLLIKCHVHVVCTPGVT